MTLLLAWLGSSEPSGAVPTGTQETLEIDAKSETVYLRSTRGALGMASVIFFAFAGFEAFLARRAAIRTNQFNPAFINWSVFNNSYENTDLAGNNHIKVNFALGELRKLGVETVAQITASQSRLPISNDTDWPSIWELWQHYYAQAFYLARFFDVHRFQMYNEPNHSPVVPTDQFLLRLRLASDAVQLAVADVNALYGKSLVAKMLATVRSPPPAACDW